jgi:flagellar protein FlaJ
MRRIPFIPVKSDKLKKIIHHYLGLGESLVKFFPKMDFELDQVEFEADAKEWLALAFYLFINYFVLIFAMVFMVAIVVKVVVFRALMISFFSGLGFGFIVFFYLILYPKLLVSRRVKNLERNLPYALRHLLIQVRSGMPLYNAFISISKGKYGLLSDEFRKAINEINTGKSEIDVLEEMTRNNPSLYLRRILWQIVNALKTGADIGTTLEEIVDNIILEQRAEIKRYGSQLNPIALFYMIMVVVFPTLGIVFLLILTSFVGTVMDLHIILIGVLMFLFLIQFMFIGMIKGKRPVGI